MRYRIEKIKGSEKDPNVVAGYVNGKQRITMLDSQSDSWLHEMSKIRIEPNRTKRTGYPSYSKYVIVYENRINEAFVRQSEAVQSAAELALSKTLEKMKSDFEISSKLITQ